MADTEPLGVRKARLVRRGEGRTEELRGALRTLYRDYLAAGGLDSVPESRSHRRSARKRPRRPG
jgi:hypothetical protein